MNFQKRVIIAEAGNNHEGSFQVAKQLILNAKKAGADAIKFQFIRPEFFISAKDKKKFSLLSAFQLSERNFKELFNYANKIKFNMFATPFDVEGAKFLNKYQKIFKISSGDNNFFDLMKVVRSFEKPTIVSLGLADEILTKKIINFFQKKRFYCDKKNFCLMHCVSSYPAKKDLINLNSISRIEQLSNSITTGYSDHTIGTEIAKMAYTMGTKIIEKHFTLSNNFSSFRDHKLSLDFKEFKKLIISLNKIDNILGEKKIKINKDEYKNINLVRRKIILTKDKEKNSVLAKKDIVYLRSSKKGFFIENLKDILKKKINQRLKKFTVLQKKYFE